MSSYKVGCYNRNKQIHNFIYNKEKSCFLGVYYTRMALPDVHAIQGRPRSNSVAQEPIIVFDLNKSITYFLHIL